MHRLCRGVYIAKESWPLELVPLPFPSSHLGSWSSNSIDTCLYVRSATMLTFATWSLIVASLTISVGGVPRPQALGELVCQSTSITGIARFHRPQPALLSFTRRPGGPAYCSTDCSNTAERIDVCNGAPLSQRGARYGPLDARIIGVFFRM